MRVEEQRQYQPSPTRPLGDREAVQPAFEKTKQADHSDSDSDASNDSDDRYGDEEPIEAMFFNADGTEYTGRLGLNPITYSYDRQQLGLHASAFQEDCVVALALHEIPYVFFVAKGQDARATADPTQIRSQIVNAFRRIAPQQQQPASGASDPRLAERINEMRQQLSALKSEKDSLAQTVETLNNELNSSQSKNSNLQNQLGNLLSELEDMSANGQVGDTSSQSSSSMATTVVDETLVAAHDELQTKYDMLLVRSRDNERHLKSKIEKLKAQLRDERASASKRSSVKVVAVQSNESSQQEIILRSDLASITDKYETLQRAHAALEEAGKSAASGGAVETLMKRLESARVDYDQLLANFNNLTQTSKEVENELRAQLSSECDANVDLQRRIKQLTQQKTEAEAESSELAGLKEQCNHLNHQGSQKDERIRHLTEELAVSAKRLGQKETEIAQLSEEVEQGQETIRQLRETLMNKAIDLQSSEVAVLKRNRAGHEDLSFAQLLERFNNLDLSHDKLQKQMREIVEALKQATRHAEVTHSQLKRERTERLELEGQLDASNATISELRQRISGLEIEIEALRSNHNEEIFRLNRGKQNLLEELGSLQSTITSSKDRENKLQIAVRNLQAQSDSLNTTANDANRRYKNAQQDLEVERQERINAGNQLDQARRELKENASERERLREEIKKLSLQLDTEMKSAARTRAALEHQLQEAKAQLEKTPALRQALQNSQHELEKIRSETMDSTTTIRNLQSQLDTEQAERIHANQSFEHLKGKFDELVHQGQVDRAGLENTISSLEGQLQGLRRDNQSLQEQLESAQSQLGQSEDQTATMQKLNSAVIAANQLAAEKEQQLRMAHNELNREREDRVALATALEQAKTQLNDARHAAEHLQNTLKQLQQQRDSDAQRHQREKQDLQADIAELQRQLNAAKNDSQLSASAQMTIGKLRDQNQEYLGQIQNYQKDLNREKNSHQETRTLCQSLKGEIAELRHRNAELDHGRRDTDALHGSNLQSLQTELSDTKARLKTAQEYSEELESRVQTFSDTLREANSTAEDQHNQIQALRKRLAAQGGEETERLMRENGQLTHEKSELIKQVHQQEAAIKHLHQNLQQAEAQLKHIQQPAGRRR